MFGLVIRALNPKLNPRLQSLELWNASGGCRADSSEILAGACMKRLLDQAKGFSVYWGCR